MFFQQPRAKKPHDLMKNVQPTRYRLKQQGLSLVQELLELCQGWLGLRYLQGRYRLLAKRSKLVENPAAYWACLAHAIALQLVWMEQIIVGNVWNPDHKHSHLALRTMHDAGRDVHDRALADWV